MSTEFIPSITSSIVPSSLERNLRSLPTKLAELGISISSELSGVITQRLQKKIKSQKRRYEHNSKLSNNIKITQF